MIAMPVSEPTEISWDGDSFVEAHGRRCEWKLLERRPDGVYEDGQLAFAQSMGMLRRVKELVAGGWEISILGNHLCELSRWVECQEASVVPLQNVA